MIKLYSYFRSSASYRVRIALAMKALPYEYIPIHLLKNGGEQFAPAYCELNPAALTPTLIAEDGTPMTQSLAIMDYLEEMYPDPPLLPRDPGDRAHVRSLALQIACEIHPIDNLRVLSYLKDELHVSDEQKSAWYAHWVNLGFDAIETTLARDPRTGEFCLGDEATLADICLVPQVFNAKRMKISMDPYPTISRINDAACALDAFAKAEPSIQPDAF